MANQGIDLTLPTASYIGAGTDFNYNVLHHIEPVDNIDAAAFRHDYAYTKDPLNASTADLITIKEMMLVKPTSVTETVHKYAGITGLALKSLIYNNASIPIAKIFASEETKIDPVVDRVYHQSINSIPTYYGVDIGF